MNKLSYYTDTENKELRICESLLISKLQPCLIKQTNKQGSPVPPGPCSPREKNILGLWNGIYCIVEVLEEQCKCLN
jgi:hypothetical protein